MYPQTVSVKCIPQVANSIWERPHDMTSRLNLRLLEEQFALKEPTTPMTPGGLIDLLRHLGQRHLTSTHTLETVIMGDPSKDK